jgi:hypothetical protein
MKRIIVPLHADHLPYLASQMSEEDRLECAAMGLGPYKALKTGLDLSVVAWCALKMPEHRPLCAFGVLPLEGFLGSHGAPWFLSTPELRKYGVSLFKDCDEYMDRMLDIFPVLVEMIDARHTRAIKWVTRWLKFELCGPFAWGPQNMPFYRAERRKN